MISVYFQSRGCHVQRTFVFCPCCAHSRLIPAIHADLCYTHFPALFSFYSVIIFRAPTGALYPIQKSGNIFLTKANLRSLKVCRSYEHREAGMQAVLWSRIKHLLSSTHGASIGKDIIIYLYKIFSFNPLSGLERRELERAP